MEAFNETYNETFKVTLSSNEKIVCLEEIISRLKKILYVYDKSQEPNSNYNYKVFCGGVALYVSSSNTLFFFFLVNIVININSILTNRLDKGQIKKLDFESINFVNYLLKKYQN